MSSFSFVMSAIFENGASKDLTAEQEVALIAAAKDGDEGATLDLLYAYGPALRSAVGHYRNAGGSTSTTDHHAIEDLRASAVAGILEAVQAFDPERHNRLAAVVKGHLRDAVSSAIVSPIAFSVPDRTRKRFFGILREAGGDVVKAAELAPKREMTVSTFMDVLAAVRAADLQLPTGGEDDTAAQSAWEAARPLWSGDNTDAEDAVLVETAFEAVDALETDVCRLAYGFADYDPQPDAVVGERLGLSRAKTQRVRSGALAKMRSALGVTLTD